jgi:chaperonin GroEL (HSP60 family)
MNYFQLYRHPTCFFIAQGLQEVLKTNLGPKGTMKMLVSGAGDIKITKVR